MPNFSLIQNPLTPEVRLAMQMYELEVTFGLTYKDGHYVKAPPFEEYLARAREILKTHEDTPP